MPIVSLTPYKLICLWMSPSHKIILLPAFSLGKHLGSVSSGASSITLTLPSLNWSDHWDANWLKSAFKILNISLEFLTAFDLAEKAGKESRSIKSRVKKFGFTTRAFSYLKNQLYKLSLKHNPAYNFFRPWLRSSLKQIAKHEFFYKRSASPLVVSICLTSSKFKDQTVVELESLF